MIKRFLSLAVALLIAFALVPAVVVYANEVSVTIDGQPLVFPDQGPAIVGGSTLVPVAGVFQALGFEVQWDGEAQQATLTRANDIVVVSVGSSTFTTNGVSHNLDVPAQLIGGRTMLPIAAVLRSVGYEVGWDGETRTVIVTSPAITPEEIREIEETVEAEEETPIEAEEPAEAVDLEDYAEETEYAEEYADEEDAEDAEETEEYVPAYLADVILNDITLQSNPSPDFVVDLEVLFHIWLLFMGDDGDISWGGGEINLTLPIDDLSELTSPATGDELTPEQVATIPVATVIYNMSNVNYVVANHSPHNTDPDNPWHNYVIDYKILIHFMEYLADVEVDREEGVITITTRVDDVEDAQPLRYLFAIFREYGVEYDIIIDGDDRRVVLAYDSLEATIFLPIPGGEGGGSVVKGDYEINVQMSIIGGTNFVNLPEMVDALREVGFIEIDLE